MLPHKQQVQHKHKYQHCFLRDKNRIYQIVSRKYSTTLPFPQQRMVITRVNSSHCATAYKLIVDTRLYRLWFCRVFLLGVYRSIYCVPSF